MMAVRKAKTGNDNELSKFYSILTTAIVLNVDCRPDDEFNIRVKVLRSAMVNTMNESDVSLWIKKLIGSFGSCITADSRRNLLQKYLQKQEAGASLVQLPASSRVDRMSFEEVSELLLNQIGSFAECKTDESQRNLLKTYLLNKELKLYCYDSEHMDPEEENGNDFILENSSQASSLKDGKEIHDQAINLEEVEVLYKRGNREHVWRPESTFVDDLGYGDLADIIRDLDMETTSEQTDRYRLKEALFSGDYFQNRQEMRNIVNTTMQKYNDIKEKLVKCYSDVIDIVQSESFKKEMSMVTEARFPHYEEELCSTKKHLQDMTSEFDIVITGETSAGKSTFLNVLLGESVLPTAHIHSTASLYWLHNSENKMIDYEAENGIENITLKDSSELRERLKSINQQLLSNNTDDDPLKRIHIYWPISSLNESVVLVDTPGIGERDTLTKKVAEYVLKSAGYIFILDSSHAGGVQDSGIKKLIEAVADVESTEEHMKGLDNVVFVCNKWDTVSKKERKAVLENTKTKLSHCCFGQLEDWQILQFNAKLELKLLEQKANPTMNLEVLFRSLQTLMCRTIERRLGSKYRWMHAFVNEVLGFFNAKRIKQTKSNEKIQADVQEATTKLKLANSHVEQIDGVHSMIDFEEEQLLQALRTSLEEHVKSELSSTKLIWMLLNKETLAHIKAGFHTAILNWARADNSPLKLSSHRITVKCNEIQNNIVSVFREIDDLKLGFNLQGATFQLDVGTILDCAFVMWSSFLFMTTVALGFHREMTLAVVCNILAVSKMMLKGHLLTSEVHKTMSILLSKNYLEKIITVMFTERHRNFLTKWEEDIKCRIDSMMKMLEELKQDEQINMDKIRTCESMQAKFQIVFEYLEELNKLT